MQEPLRDIESIAHGIVLLQEICQGYDKPSYRERAAHYLVHGGNHMLRNYYVPRWYNNVISTQECIRQIEVLLEEYV